MRPLRPRRLGETAVDEDDLPVDPAAGSGQERDGLGDVLGLPEPLQRDGAGEPGHLFKRQVGPLAGE